MSESANKGSDSSLRCLSGPRDFRTTHWTNVLAAGDGSPAASAALEELCRTYWYPLYAFIRRQGHSAEDAQDLTQGFFGSLLERQSLQEVHPGKGKFRSFLLASLDHFLANDWRRHQAQRRGGGRALFSLDGADAEERYRFEPTDSRNPETIFERRWAITLLEHTLCQLGQECSAADRADLFLELKGMLSGGDHEERYSEIASRLGMREGAVKKAAQRLRDRYRELLREAVAETVTDPAEVDDELRYLFRALQS